MQKYNINYGIGDIFEDKVTPRNFGRIAAQTAKQVVVQRIREAERGIVYDEFINRSRKLLPERSPGFRGVVFISVWEELKPFCGPVNKFQMRNTSMETD